LTVPVHLMMALGASAPQCCMRSRPRLARSNLAPTEPGGMAVAIVPAGGSQPIIT
jgi:hypothetical protein